MRRLQWRYRYLSSGFMADPLRPSVGPSGLITGYSPGALPIPGWSNWDCSKRNCPMGHTSDARRLVSCRCIATASSILLQLFKWWLSGYKAVKEIQRIVCGLSVYNDEQSFTLSFMDHQTSPIYTNYSATGHSCFDQHLWDDRLISRTIQSMMNSLQRSKLLLSTVP